MNPNFLSQNRVDRLLAVLERQGGVETVRQLQRRFAIQRWEIEQAVEFGFLEFSVRRPTTGRPAIMVQKVSKTEHAKLPFCFPTRERTIKFHHILFAKRSIFDGVAGGIRTLWKVGFPGRIPCITDIYQSQYSSARSRAGAAASASRLLRHRDVKAARAWFRAAREGKIPGGVLIPNTAPKIWQALANLRQ